MKHLRVAVVGLFAVIGALASMVTIVQWIGTPTEELSAILDEVPFNLPSAIKIDVPRFHEAAVATSLESRSRYFSPKDKERLDANPTKVSSELCSLREWREYDRGQDAGAKMVRMDVRNAWRISSPLEPYADLKSFVRLKLTNTGTKKLDSVRIITRDFTGFISIRQDRTYSFRSVEKNERIELSAMEPGDVAFVNGWARWVHDGLDIYADRGKVEPTRRALAGGVGLWISRWGPSGFWSWLWVALMYLLHLFWTARLFSGPNSTTAGQVTTPVVALSDKPPQDVEKQGDKKNE